MAFQSRICSPLIYSLTLRLICLFVIFHFHHHARNNVIMLGRENVFRHKNVRRRKLEKCLKEYTTHNSVCEMGKRGLERFIPRPGNEPTNRRKEDFFPFFKITIFSE